MVCPAQKAAEGPFPHDSFPFYGAVWSTGVHPRGSPRFPGPARRATLGKNRTYFSQRLTAGIPVWTVLLSASPGTCDYFSPAGASDSGLTNVASGDNRQKLLKLH